MLHENNECKFVKIIFFSIFNFHISVTDETADGRDDEPSHEVSSEVFSPEKHAEEEDEGGRGEEENKEAQEDQGEEWGVHAHSAISNQVWKWCMSVS